MRQVGPEHLYGIVVFNIIINDPILSYLILHTVRRMSKVQLSVVEDGLFANVLVESTAASVIYQSRRTRRAPRSANSHAATPFRVLVRGCICAL